jgi:DNA-directed RNA polymerase subunit F
MSAEEENERLLTHLEVKKVLEESMEKPSVIYTGPEEDSGRQQPEGESEFQEEIEEDPLQTLSFEKRSTMDHVSNFIRIHEKVDPLIKELTKIERVSDVHAYKIAELMPRDETELRPIFAKDRFTLTPEELKQILDIIDSHRD